MWPGQEKSKQPKITVTQKTSCSDSAISGLSGWTKIKPLGPAASVTDQYRYKPKNSEMERDRAPSIMSGSSSSRGKAFSLMSGGSSHSNSSVSKMLKNAKSDIKESAYEGCGGPLGPARTKEERRNRKLLIAGVCSSALLIILCLALKEIGYNNSLKEIMDEVEKDEVEISEDIQPFIPNQNMYPGMINPYFINPYLFQQPMPNQPMPNQPINQHTLTVSSNQQDRKSVV